MSEELKKYRGRCQTARSHERRARLKYYNTRNVHIEEGRRVIYLEEERTLIYQR